MCRKMQFRELVHVLVVEDNLSVAKSIGSTFIAALGLANMKTQIEYASDAFSAFTLTGQSSTFDIIICDYDLGAGPSGEDFIGAISSVLPNVYFIMVSGHEHDKLTDAVIKVHNLLKGEARIDFLQKPIRLPAAITCVERFQRLISDESKQFQPPEVFISYAWGSNESKQDKLREQFVDELCEAARKRGVKIVRDKTHIELGELIKDFMIKMASHSKKNGIFVVLSEKYLQSIYCMYELHEIFRACGQKDSEFARRVRVWTLPDARIWSSEDRLSIAKMWHEKAQKLSKLIDKTGRLNAGKAALLEERMINEFAYNTADILSLIVGILNPQKIEDVNSLSFEDIKSIISD